MKVKYEYKRFFWICCIIILVSLAMYCTHLMEGYMSILRG